MQEEQYKSVAAIIVKQLERNRTQLIPAPRKAYASKVITTIAVKLGHELTKNDPNMSEAQFMDLWTPDQTENE